MSTVERFCHYMDVTNQWVGKVISFLVIPLTLTVTFEVVMRYIFNRPQIWTGDTNLMLFGILGVLGGGYCLQRREHIRVDVLVELLSKNKRKIADLLSGTFILGGGGVLLWKVMGFAWDSILTRETVGGIWNVPLYPCKVIMFVGVLLLIFQGIANFVLDLMAIIRPR